MRWIFWILTCFFFAKSINAQGIFYLEARPNPAVGNDYIIWSFAPDICVYTEIVKIDDQGLGSFFRLLDLAITPDGRYWVIGNMNTSWNEQEIGEVDINTGIVSNITSMSTGFWANSLTSDEQGLLYAMGNYLISFDPATGIGTAISPPTPLWLASAGDLTFHLGKLYLTSVSNNLYEIDISDIYASTNTMSYAVLPNWNVWGIVSDFVNCDTSVFYAFNVNQLLQETQVNILNIETQTVTYICTIPGKVVGAATLTENQGSGCHLDLDLDSDNSSGAMGIDYQSAPVCAADSVPVCDVDLVLKSGYIIDSVVVTLAFGTLDGVQEALYGQNSGAVLASGSGTHRVALINTTGAVDTNFRDALRQVYWADGALPATPGDRAIEVVLYAGARLSDTARAAISVQPIAFAGTGRDMAVCADAMGFSLMELLSTGASAQGSWYPSDTFVPVGSAQETFYYAVNNGACPADTAYFSIQVHPLPAVWLGPDTLLCASDSIVLAAGSHAAILWQDGSSDSIFLAQMDGVYWVAVTDAYGCGQRDTVVVNFSSPDYTTDTLWQCAGLSLSYMGQVFWADTAVCHSFTRVGACDSVHCQTLQFQYGHIAIDTTLCAGNTLQIYGQPYSVAGFYTDTIAQMGCLSEFNLSLQITPVDTAKLDVQLCAGDSVFWGGQYYHDTGYFTWAGTSVGGCDSAAILHLEMLPSISVAADTAVCSGVVVTSFGQQFAQPGVFTFTLPSAECDTQVVYSISWLPLDSTSVYDSLCLGETLDFYGISLQDEGIYYKTLANTQGCDSVIQLHLRFKTVSEVSIEKTGHLCLDSDSVSLAATPGFSQYQWSEGSVGAAIGVDSAGVYSVTATDAGGCTVVSYIDVYSSQAPLVELLGPPAHSEVEAIASPPDGYDFQWEPADLFTCDTCALPGFLGTMDTVISLILTDSNGCAYLSSLLIEFPKFGDFYVPNVFAPNGQMVDNQRFRPFSSNIEFLFMRIYDRWGELVFEEKPINEGWTGNCGNRPCTPGVYLYVLVYRDALGFEKVWSGDVLLVK